MVRALALGQDLAWIAQWSGRSARTVRFWLERFREQGLPALADAPRPGRPARADAAYRQALEAAVDTPPRTLALPFDVWTSARLSAYLAETTGVRIAPGWLRVLLHRADFVRGRPKHTLKHLQDPEAVAASKAELAEVGKKGGGRPDAL
jgi:transposase